MHRQFSGQAYYGGEARCEVDMGLGGGGEAVAGGYVDSFNPAELVCGGCSDVSRAQMCPRHGADYLEYKCRYCCSVAVFFCFGTTHFCNACHEDFRPVTEMPKHALPKCPAGQLPLLSSFEIFRFIGVATVRFRESRIRSQGRCRRVVFVSFDAAVLS